MQIEEAENISPESNIFKKQESTQDAKRLGEILWILDQWVLYDVVTIFRWARPPLHLTLFVRSFVPFIYLFVLSKLKIVSFFQKGLLEGVGEHVYIC